MAGPLTRQPGNTLYTFYTLIRTLCRLPSILLLNILPSFRPHPTWTYRQAIWRVLLGALFGYASTIRYKRPFHLRPGKEEGRFVTMKPHRNHNIYQGILLCDETITPTTIGGTWHPEPPSALVAGQRIFLHFHGGAYVLGGCRNADVQFCATMLLKTSPGALILFPQYRLGSYGGRFPAQLQDALTAYAHLLFDLHIAAGDIVVSGDSAGGNLALALLRYVSEGFGGLPSPGACLLWSPWTDLSLIPSQISQRPAVRTDYVPPVLLSWAYEEFLPRWKDAGQSEWISPVVRGVKTQVPIWVQWGSFEVIAADIVRFVAVQKEEGGRVAVWVSEGAPHDIFAAGGLTGWEKEADEAVRAAVRWLNKGA